MPGREIPRAPRRPRPSGEAVRDRGRRPGHGPREARGSGWRHRASGGTAGSCTERARAGRARGDRLVARGLGDAAAPGEKHDGGESHHRGPGTRLDLVGMEEMRVGEATLDGPRMTRVKRSSPRSARLVDLRDTRRGAGRASAAAGSTMATSSPSSAAPRAHSAQASVDLPASPRPASRIPRPSHATRAPCTITTGDSTIAATAPYSTALTARAALGTRRSAPADDRTRHSASVPRPFRRSTRQARLGSPASWVAQGRKTVAARVRTAGSSDASSKRNGPAAQRTGGPADARGHETGTIAPCRVSSSRERGDVSARGFRTQRRKPLSQGGREVLRTGGSGEPLPEPAASGVQDEGAPGRPMIEHHPIADGGHLDLVGSRVGGMHGLAHHARRRRVWHVARLPTVHARRIIDPRADDLAFELVGVSPRSTREVSQPTGPGSSPARSMPSGHGSSPTLAMGRRGCVSGV